MTSPIWCTRISLWPCWLPAVSCYRSRRGCSTDAERLSKLTAASHSLSGGHCSPVVLPQTRTTTENNTTAPPNTFIVGPNYRALSLGSRRRDDGSIEAPFYCFVRSRPPRSKSWTSRDDAKTATTASDAPKPQQVRSRSYLAAFRRFSGLARLRARSPWTYGTSVILGRWDRKIAMISSM
uniref:Putative secreted protein n=1 Tax=Ixodes ricinus TaxID=34613 RepID=A0A6B0UZB9_IXORI